MMNFAFKMMEFALKMVNFVFKMTSFSYHPVNNVCELQKTLVNTHGVAQPYAGRSRLVRPATNHNLISLCDSDGPAVRAITVVDDGF